MNANNYNQTVPKPDFVAIDIEYADSAQNICQVGLAVVHNLEVTETLSWLICPPDNHYEDRFTEVHHITPFHTVLSPEFKEVWPEIEEKLRGMQLWAHNATSVEGPVLEKNLRYHGIEDGPYRIYDSRDLYQRPDCEPNKGNGLEQCCMALGIPCENHHDALADAEMCARIIIAYQKREAPRWENIPKDGEELRKMHQDKRMLHLGEFCDYYINTTSGEEDVFCEIASTYPGAPMQVVDVFDKGDRQPGENEGRVDFSRLDTSETNPLYGKRVVLTGMFNIRRSDIEDALKMMGARKTGAVSGKTDAVLIGTRNVGFNKLCDIETQLQNGRKIALIVGNDDLEELLYADMRQFFS